MDWSDTTITKLRDLWESGAAVKTIVNEIGAPSRNSVIGKANRLGLARRPSPITSRGRLYYRNKAGGLSVIGLTEPAETPAPTMEWSGAAKAMDDMKEGCKWPIGDPRDDAFEYCGCRKQAGAVYCTKHKSMSYAPDTRRRSLSS